jgi:hypothetical protein
MTSVLPRGRQGVLLRQGGARKAEQQSEGATRSNHPSPAIRRLIQGTSAATNIIAVALNVSIWNRGGTMSQKSAILFLSIRYTGNRKTDARDHTAGISVCGVLPSRAKVKDGR